MTPQSFRYRRLPAGFALAFGASCLSVAVVQAANAADTAAFAVSPEQAGASNNDIVVTATKRGTSTLLNVPISMDAITGAQLAAKGALDFNDFYHQVPGLSIQDEGPGDKRYILRGINATGAGTIGVYLDEVIITGQNSQDGSGQQPDIQLFDIDRVEVLKGPQGTTFGSSSMAGTIRYITVKPDLNKFGGYLSGSLVSTEGASLGYRTEGAVNIPIIPGLLAVRASGLYVNLPGWIDSRFGKGINNNLTKAGRIEAKFTPTENLTISGMFMAQRTHQDGKGFYNIDDYSGNQISFGDHYEQANVARAPWDDRMHIYNATAEWQQHYGTFTVTASSFRRSNQYNVDGSLAAQVYVGLPYATTGRSVLEQPHKRVVNSYEARFASKFDSPFQILAGAFMQDENRRFRSYWPTSDDAGYAEADPTAVILDRSVHTKIHEKSLFGEASYQLTEKLKATVGGRYYHFSLNEQSASVSAGALPSAHFKESGFIPRFNIAYKITPDINTYIQAAKGYRSGGTNDQSAVELAKVAIPEGYGSDSLWNYEAGIKTSLFNHKLTFNAAAYYIDWSKIQSKAQATTDDGLTFPYTANGGAAHIKGVEAELGLNLVRGLRFSATGNFNDAKLAQDNTAPTVGNKGDSIPYVPKWAFAASVDYERPLPAWGVTGVIGVDWNYTGPRNTAYNSEDDTFEHLPKSALWNGHVGVNRDAWTATLNVKNILNSHKIINYNDIVPEYYPDGYYIQQPRTVMMTVSVKY